ncbi:hypothetical protein EDD80_101220 [Anseongella ginsenosidimutans]|uniref:Protein SCO1/2 n=1 Tax=Anseongella ginsenosidimutans TaxID=496056 RepID=A0A4R3L0U7_9SPHI|nr:hypothetical protein [Anseongella ginsenosidimutans]QEC51287.1 hypothetical protein FRZ59_02255 [Anseongella ginsenosidimutans]TCS90022.1 hypothetical protein EDD80_101220 [Anseongella ginsenosidimutans]
MGLSKRLKKTVLALFVLVIPGICYMLLRTGTNYYHSLPVYGPEGAIELSDSLPDSAWFKFNLSRFISPGGEVPALDSKMYVAGFLRGPVSAEAETLAVNMVRLAKTYYDLKRLKFVAFIATDSTETITPSEELLLSYAGEGEKWLRLRMPEAAIGKVMREGLLFAPNSSSGTGLPMSDTLVLIDSRKRIRGYYDGTSYFATDTLEDEISVLWKEEMNRDDNE